MNSRERFLATMNYGDFDHASWLEMWYWNETVPIWRKQGLPADVHLEQYLGIDRREVMEINLGLVPGFEPETIEESESYIISRRADGIVCKRFKVGTRQGHMPQWLSFPMQTRADWEERFRPRLDPTSPCRYPLYWEEQVRHWAGRDHILRLRAGSIFGVLRNWMGLEGISVALCDDPAWVQEMMDYMAEFLVTVLGRALQEVEIDYITVWEDMAYKAGPLISPAMFRRHMLEPYKKLTSLFHANGAHLILVDCDGYAEPLIPLWLEGGVTGLWPVERASGMDPVALRERYGRELRLMGGIDKRAVKAGPRETDAELAHVAPLAVEGGYIPLIDHLVPPDISWERYLYYLKRMKEMTLDPAGFAAQVQAST